MLSNDSNILNAAVPIEVLLYILCISYVGSMLYSIDWTGLCGACSRRLNLQRDLQGAPQVHHGIDVNYRLRSHHPPADCLGVRRVEYLHSVTITRTRRSLYSLPCRVYSWHFLRKHWRTPSRHISTRDPSIYSCIQTTTPPLLPLHYIRQAIPRSTGVH